MSDAAKSNHDSWDEKFRQVLWQLQDYQEAKDHPQAQVVDVGVEELFVVLSLVILLDSNSLHLVSVHDSSLSSINTSFANFISTLFCGRKNWRFNIIWQDMIVNERVQKQNRPGLVL
jgi:hypothetical protein